MIKQVNEYNAIMDCLLDDSFMKEFTIIIPFSPEYNSEYEMRIKMYSSTLSSHHVRNAKFNGDDKIFEKLLNVVQPVLEDHAAPARKEDSSFIDAYAITWYLNSRDYPEITQELIDVIVNDYNKKNDHISHAIDSAVIRAFNMMRNK